MPGKRKREPRLGKREPHRDTPFEELTVEQRFDRLLYHRKRQVYARFQERRYTAAFVEKFGAAAREHLPPGTSVDAAGVVHFADEYEQNERWREAVGAYHAVLGNVILDRLPPDTTIDPATGEVAIDPDKKAWL